MGFLHSDSHFWQKTLCFYSQMAISGKKTLCFYSQIAISAKKTLCFYNQNGHFGHPGVGRRGCDFRPNFRPKKSRLYRDGEFGLEPGGRRTETHGTERDTTVKTQGFTIRV